MQFENHLNVSNKSKKHKATAIFSLTMVIFILFSFLSMLQIHVFAQHIHGISLQEVLTIGREEGDELYQWAGVCSDSIGNVYVSDMIDYSIKCFDSSGKLLKKVGRKGKEPGEFMGVRLISIYKDLLYVTDQYIPGIQVFDRSLCYKYRINYQMPIMDFHNISTTSTIISPLQFHESGNLLVLNRSGNVKKQIRFTNKKENPLFNAICFICDSDSNIYLAFKFQDKILGMDSQGKLLWELNLFDKISSKTKNIHGFSMPEKMVYIDIAIDKHEFIYILSGSFSQHKKMDIYVLSKHGKHLTTFSLPEPSHCIYIDNDNCLYARSGMGTMIKKYKILYN
jgi:hypothetical protein